MTDELDAERDQLEAGCINLHRRPGAQAVREPYVDRDELNQIARNHQVEIRMLYAEIERLRTLLKSAAYHVDSEGDVSLLAMIRAALEPKP